MKRRICSRGGGEAGGVMRGRSPRVGKKFGRGGLGAVWVFFGGVGGEGEKRVCLINKIKKQGAREKSERRSLLFPPLSLRRGAWEAWRASSCFWRKGVFFLSTSRSKQNKAGGVCCKGSKRRGLGRKTKKQWLLSFVPLPLNFPLSLSFSSFSLSFSLFFLFLPLVLSFSGKRAKESSSERRKRKQRECKTKGEQEMATKKKQ